MTYASPTQLRRRQRAAENRAGKKRATRQIKVSSEAEWGKSCDFHIGEIEAKSNYPDSVFDHARALVHMAIERRAAEIQRSQCCARNLALRIARNSLLNTEVA